MRKPDKEWFKYSPRKQQSNVPPDLTMHASEHSISILQHQISSVLNKTNPVGCDQNVNTSFNIAHFVIHFTIGMCV
ncbi:hypothetical protein TNCV_625661 [Trichonephila clavipes]|nr:hypothetical protein TNCV_625661 [Trichonephila clavipes]